MSGVDNRIVTMKFDNKEFEQNAKASMSTLQKLKSQMDFGAIAGATVRALGTIDSALSKIGLKTPFSGIISVANKGLNGIGVLADKIGVKNPFGGSAQGAADLQKAAADAGGPRGMGYLEGGVTAVSARFIALSTIAITALSNITNRAINAGTAFGKSFTVQPILDGLHEYETNLKAIQTVQANTDRPLPEINKALQDLNTYSDQTIYNFGEMAKNVGTFTAAGVDLQTSVQSIKGIANLAALSGSSSEQAATAMYQLSQAISSGRVGLQDWNSVVNAGMGGKKLQNQLLQTAVAMGKIKESSVKLVGPMKKLTVNGESFRESIMAKPGQESWLSSDILVNTLASLDGRFSKSYQLSLLNADGTKKYTAKQVEANMVLARTNLEKKNGVKFTDEQFKALQKMSNSATNAATQVKTLGQVFDIARESIGSGWSASFVNIFGNLKEAKKLFTDMSNGLGNIIRQNALTRNNMLAEWKKKGGRNDLIEGLTTAWNSFRAVLGAVTRGFRQVFPAKTATDLLNFSKSFKELMARLTPSIETLAKIQKISKGVFAVFGIGKILLGGVVDGLKALFGAVGGGQGDFLTFAGNIGQIVYEFEQFLKKSGIVSAFFITLGQILSVPLNIVRGFASAIGALFGGFDEETAKKVGDAVDGVGKRFAGVQAIGEKLKSFFQNLGGIFQHIGEFIGSSLVKIGPAIASAFTSDTFGRVLDTINTGLFAGIVLLLKNFFSNGVKIDATGGLFASIKETLGSVTSAFTNMQQNLKANIILKLAIAMGVMAGSLLLLSTIDPKALTKAMVAMSAGFGVLIGAMVVLLKVTGPAGLLQIYVVTAALSKMALAILLLALAVKTMASMEFADMSRGLTGIAAVMFILNKAITPLAANSAGMAKASFSLILIGIALNILAVALKVFATMSWPEMIKGLAGLTGTLIALSIGLKLMPEMKAEALGLLALGIAINLIAVALKIFATMSWEEMAKGLVALAGSLLIISLAINSMPKTMLLQAAGLLVVSAALVVLSGALKVMGSMGWESIAKGLVVLGGSLLIIALAMKAMGPSAILGAAALVLVAFGLNALLPVLLAFGAMKWSTLLKSIAGLALVFVVLGAAGYLLSPVIVTILALGAALVLIGTGLVLAGTAALAFATAFGIIVGVGAAGIQVLAGLLAALVAAIAPALAALALGVVQFIAVLGENAPAIAAAFGQILMSLLDTVNNAIPRMGEVVLTLLNTILRVLVQGIPRIANAGYRIIIALLTVIANNIPKIIQKGAEVIIAFIRGIGKQAGPLANAAAKALIDFLNGLSKAIDDNAAAIGKAGADIGIAIVKGVVVGLGAAGGEIKNKMIDLAKDAWEGVKNFLGIGSPSKLFEDTVGVRMPQGMAIGVRKGAPAVVEEIGTLGEMAVSKMSEVMRGVEDAFAMSPDLAQPTITPVLDLSGVSKEATKMSSILANAPIMATVSHQQASDISTSINPPSNGPDDGTGTTPGNGSGGKGDTKIDLTLELHSPKAIDSVDAYRAGKSLISLAKEALENS